MNTPISAGDACKNTKHVEHKIYAPLFEKIREAIAKGTYVYEIENGLVPYEVSEIQEYLKKLGYKILDGGCGSYLKISWKNIDVISPSDGYVQKGFSYNGEGRLTFYENGEEVGSREITKSDGFIDT